MATKDTHNWITLNEAAELMGVETRSATHIEGTRPDGSNLCLKAEKLYSRADALQIKKTRDEKAAAAKAAKDAKAAEREPVERHTDPQAAQNLVEAVSAGVGSA